MMKNLPLRALTLALCALLLGSVAVMSAPVHAQAEPPTEAAPAWNGQSRFTLLMMGMDRRPNARDTLSVRTDAMFLVSLLPGETPEENHIGILHIPRDLHFTPYGTIDFVRVNTLLVLGEELQTGYGPYYAMDTLQYNLGLYVDRYVAFDFEAFIALVDAIGGVTITTGYLINDPTYPDMNYGYDPFYLPPGTHLMDGRTALKFARTRHNDNDYERGRRQLQVIAAIQEKIVSEDLMPLLIGQAPALYQALDGKFYTDLMLADMIQVALYMRDVPAENIHTGVIDNDYIMRYGLPNGTTVFIPHLARMPDLLTEVFGENYVGR